MRQEPATNEKPRKAGGPYGAVEQNGNRQAHYTNLLDLGQGFKAHIAQEFGLDLLGDLNTDGGFHYLATSDDKKGHKPFRYCVHIDDPANVYFNDLKRGFHGTWYPKGH